MPLKHVLAAAFAAASVLVTTTAQAHAANAPAAPLKAATFTDAAGDNGTAPDIAGVSVVNDASSYIFDVTFGSDYATDAQFYLYLDTDKSPRTGDPARDGADYAVFDDHAAHAADLYRWNGTEWDDTAEDTLRFEIDPNLRSLEITVGASDIGDVKSLDFYVVAIDNANPADSGYFDDAPSGSGVWEYSMQTAFTLGVVATKQFVDKKAHTWDLAVAVARSDTNKLVDGNATLACLATAAGVKLPVLGHAFVSAGAGQGSLAVCRFKLPKKHLKLTAKVTVSYLGRTATKTVTAKS